MKSNEWKFRVTCGGPFICSILYLSQLCNRPMGIISFLERKTRFHRHEKKKKTCACTPLALCYWAAPDSTLVCLTGISPFADYCDVLFYISQDICMFYLWHKVLTNENTNMKKGGIACYMVLQLILLWSTIISGEFYEIII